MDKCPATVKQLPFFGISQEYQEDTDYISFLEKTAHFLEMDRRYICCESLTTLNESLKAEVNPMANDVFYLVSDNYQMIERVKSFCHSQGVTVEVYSPAEWENKMNGQMQSSLSTGQAPIQTGATIIPFPGGNHGAPASASTGQDGRVRTINELESIAIENAIFEFNGNLTEAAKALGIGRATLYRKVKQYNIDPSLARKKRAA